MAIDWKKEYLDLYHVARNLQIALSQDFRSTEHNRRRADGYVRTLGVQLESMIERIPDEELKEENQNPR